MAKDNPRVFVSSTFEDLAEYRNAVRDALLRVGAMPIVMEDLPASGTTIDEAVSQAVDQSDAMLLLVGHRYGAIDPKTGKSWIEAEYEAAKRRKKPLLVFLAADDAPWPPKFIDAERGRIQEFRERLASDVVVHSFRGPDDLRVRVMEALSRWVAALERPPDIKEKQPPRKREIRIIRLLLSSPGDVADERERVARAVFRFNQEAVEESGLFVKLVRWEDMAPQIGPKAQAVINKQIGEYHLFCGIMWNRFGTPTEIAASGTKEEFDGAVTCWGNGGRPWITFYFCDRPANFTTPEQLEQKRLVLEFRMYLNDKGVVRTFLAAQEFEEKVYEDLKRIAKIPEFLRMLEAG
jgi:Domain of unknown function (DUF4062)